MSTPVPYYKGTSIALQFKDVFCREFPKVRYYAYSYLCDMEQARNVAQDVFMQLWKHREQVSFNECLLPWLLLLARNFSLNLLRKEKNRKAYEHYRENHALNLFHLDALESDSASTLYAQEVKSLFYAGLDKMSPAVRETFLLSRRQELTYPEIAQILQISVKTVEGRITQALRTLRKVLQDYLPLFIGVGAVWLFLL